MKHDIDGIDTSKIISRYVILNDSKIIRTIMLDGSYVDYEYSIDMEKNIISKMINQAYKSNGELINDINFGQRRLEDVAAFGTCLTISVLGTIISYDNCSNIGMCLFGLIGSVSFAGLFINLIGYLKNTKEIDDIKKYIKFLEYHRNLKNDEILTIDNKPLTINNVDEFSKFKVDHFVRVREK